MSRAARSLLIGPFIVILGASLLLLPSRATIAQAVVPAPVSGRYLGVASCANSTCHGSMQPLGETAVLQNEYHAWLSNDRHAGAYNVLFNQKSARIVRNLRLEKPAHQQKICLDCHSTNVSPSLVSGRIDPEDGVQCEACHGPASGWRDSHFASRETHAQSVAQGMNDLRDLAVRAHVCNGCHVGSSGHEVDHEMIAAGHPLLAFELDNYTAAMPPHWNVERSSAGANAWAVGQIVAFADSLANLSRHARTQWPEFSDMTCSTCHFALTEQSVAEGGGGRVGLPSWNPRHWIVARHVIARVAPQTRKQIDAQLAKLGPTAARMNDAKNVADGADAVRTAVLSTLPVLRQTRWSAGDIRSMMKLIAASNGAGAHSDLQSAEQIALALQTLAVALGGEEKDAMSLMPAIDGLFAELDKKYDYDGARFDTKLAEVRKRLDRTK